jgi:hypothetical protein
MRRAAALLGLALAAACGKPDPAQVELLNQLRSVCSGLTATPTTYEDALLRFGAVPALITVAGTCDPALIYPPGSSCPTAPVVCRVTWGWQPSDIRLCSTGGICLYTCEAYAPGAQAGNPTLGEVICSSVSLGP